MHGVWSSPPFFSFRNNSSDNQKYSSKPWPASSLQFDPVHHLALGGILLHSSPGMAGLPSCRLRKVPGIKTHHLKVAQNPGDMLAMEEISSPSASKRHTSDRQSLPSLTYLKNSRLFFLPPESGLLLIDFRVDRLLSFV